MNSLPKVSVIIPNYNHNRFLSQRLQSILDQTFADFEMIYLDDASTDHSDAVIAAVTDRRLTHVIKNDVNSGSPFKQWNKGAALAKGEYLWIAESDDYADARFLERLVDLLDRHSNVGLAYCQSWGVNESDRIFQSWQVNTDELDRERWQEDFVNQGRNECQRYLIFKNTIPNASAVLLRRRVFEVAGGAAEHLRLCGDWWTWIEVLWRSDVAFVAEPLNYFRTHQTSVRERGLKYLVYAEESYRVLQHLLQRLETDEVPVGISDTIREQVFQVMMERWCQGAIAHASSRSLEVARSYHRRIYKLARRLDPQFRQRFVKTLRSLPFQEITRLQRQAENAQAKQQHLQSRLEQTQQELLEAQQRIAAMETSKFWQLRSTWFKLKRSIGIPTIE